MQRDRCRIICVRQREWATESYRGRHHSAEVAVNYFAPHRDPLRSSCLDRWNLKRRPSASRIGSSRKWMLFLFISGLSHWLRLARTFHRIHESPACGRRWPGEARHHRRARARREERAAYCPLCKERSVVGATICGQNEHSSRSGIQVEQFDASGL